MCCSPRSALALVVAALTGLAQAYGFDSSLLADSRAPGGTLGNRNFLAHLMAIGAPSCSSWLSRGAGTAARRRAQGRASVSCGGDGADPIPRRLARRSAISSAVMVRSLADGPAGRPAARARPAPACVLARGGRAVAAALLLPNRLSWRSDSPYRDTMRDLTNYREGSGRGRLIQYRNSAALIGIDPVFGAGPGNWPVKYPLVTTPGDPSFAGADPMPTNPWPSSDWVAFLTERGAWRRSCCWRPSPRWG